MARLFLISLLLLAACAPQAPRTKILGPTPLPGPTAAEKACARFSAYEHEQLPVLEAAQNHDDASKFARIMQSLKDLDSVAYQVLSEQTTDGLTLFLPTNYAFDRFEQEYELNKLSADRLEALIKTHIVLESTYYRNLFDGQDYASNMNAFTTRFAKNGSDCVIVNESAEFILVEDICFNGLVYQINEVLIPDDGL